MLASQRQCTCVVVVAPERRQAVGARIGRGEPRHACQPLSIDRTRFAAAGAQCDGREQEQLRDQAVVSGRRLEVHAIRMHLQDDLVLDVALARRQPALRLFSFAKQHSDDDQRGGIRREVVAIHVGAFEVFFREHAMQEQRAQETLAKRRIRERGAVGAARAASMST